MYTAHCMYIFCIPIKSIAQFALTKEIMHLARILKGIHSLYYWSKVLRNIWTARILKGWVKYYVISGQPLRAPSIRITGVKQVLLDKNFLSCDHD